MSSTKFMTVQEAADYLEVSRAKISTMLRQGDLTAITNPLNQRQKLIEVGQLDSLKIFMEDTQEETEAEMEEIRQTFKEGEAEMKAGTLYSLDDILERAAQILANSDKFNSSKSA